MHLVPCRSNSGRSSMVSCASHLEPHGHTLCHGHTVIPCSTSEPNKYSQEELALMRTQDVKYVAMKERVEAEVRGQSSAQSAACVRAALHAAAS